MSAAARTRWGYHRLLDSPARALVEQAGIRPGALVVDLGAGTGAITRQLLAAGAHVLAVELHPGRCDLLRERYGGPACRVLQADVTGFALPRRPFRVVANPPFAVLAATLRRLTAPSSRMERADLVVPAHLATRCSRGAMPGIGRRFAARTAYRLPASAFRPPATQPVAVLVVVRRGPSATSAC